MIGIDPGTSGERAKFDAVERVVLTGAFRYLAGTVFPCHTPC